jgi:hypothetical protein
MINRISVVQTASEKYIYQFLEVHAVTDLEGAGMLTYAGVCWRMLAYAGVC